MATDKHRPFVNKTSDTLSAYEAGREQLRRMEADIEQHHFDKLVAQGLIVEGAFEKGVTPQGGGVGFSHSVSRNVNEKQECQVNT